MLFDVGAQGLTDSTNISAIAVPTFNSIHHTPLVFIKIKRTKKLHITL